MPLHVAPVLRQREEVLETKGITQTSDSRGVTIQKALELAGTIKRIPKMIVVYLGTKTSFGT